MCIRDSITPERGGVNRIAPPAGWAEAIVERTLAINSWPQDEFVSCLLYTSRCV